MNTKHEPFDETAKAFYQRLFKSWGLKVETEQTVFSRQRTIDLAVTCTEADQKQLENTVFAHFRKLNSLELKGFHDPLTVANYFRIMMRVWALGDHETEQRKLEQKLSPDKDHTPPLLANQVTVTIVCVTRPDNILTKLKKDYCFVQTEDGIYHCDEVLGKWIIHPSELDLVPKNYPLLPLARGQKLEDFISLCLREGLDDYLRLIVDIGLATDPELIWRKILEVKQMKHQIREETWPVIDQFFQEMPEAIGKLPTFQDALAETKRQSLQQGEEWGALDNEHRTIIRQLYRKFNHIPTGIVNKIEATSDLDQLDNWLDQIMSANKLVDIDFKQPQKTLSKQ